MGILFLFLKDEGVSLTIVFTTWFPSPQGDSFFIQICKIFFKQKVCKMFPSPQGDSFFILNYYNAWFGYLEYGFRPLKGILFLFK